MQVKECACCEHEHSQIKNNSKEEKEPSVLFKILRFGTGILFFAAGLLASSEWLNGYLKTVFLFAAYFILGYDILYSALINTVKGKLFDENFLMAIATVGAIIIGEQSEAVGVMLFYQIGETFQEYAVGRSRKSIKSLLDLRPDYANVVGDNGSVTKIAPEKVKVSQVIQVLSGERVPLDGTLLYDTMSADTAALTGESRPRDISKGGEVLSGVINLSGAVNIEVTSLYENGTIARLLELVESAADKKAKNESFITKFSKIYTPAVVISAALLAILGSVITGNPSDWMYRALVFLVVSCPCALVVSIPLSYFAGIGLSSKNGILIKGSNYLEALTSCKTAVFDKTGTLTKGSFTVIETAAFLYDQNEILRLAAMGESMSTHPIAKSIVKRYGSELDTAKIKNHTEYAGMGVGYQTDGSEILVGSTKLLKFKEVPCDLCTVSGAVYVAVDGNVAGYLIISDQIKESAQALLNIKKETDITKTVMLTGDDASEAAKISEKLGIDEYYASLMPEKKLEILETIAKTENVIFVGDGINDAPVLKRANVGVAMGGLGSDAAIEAADIVIMNDSPAKLITAVKIAKRTKTIVIQNIVFVLFVKAVILLLGIFGIANMWLAVFADVGVSLLATLNAVRLIAVRISADNIA